MRVHRALLVFSILVLILHIAAVSPFAQNPNPGALETPEHFFGFKPGADRMLFDYEALIAYLQKLDAASARVKLVEIGASPQGRTMYIAFISSERNIERLDELKEINRRLALDPAIPDAERRSMLDDGKVFFLATLSMHSGEVGPSQSAPSIAYDLAATNDPEVLAWLDSVVYMMVPCHNPDGMDMIVNHYKKYAGTKYETSSMPGVYHRYVGHDNNRDFVTLTQSDTKAIARIYNTEWFPQVMVEKHQMGSRGPRYFVPPVHDPIAENVNESVWNWTWVLGSNLITDMTKAGLAGVSQHNLFDDYWPGSTETCIWKNVVGILTEAASARYATPLYIEPNELGGYGKGLSEYKKSINMPLPWPGGWWRLGDIVDYEIVSTISIIKTCAMHRRELLEHRNDVCRDEVEKGMTEPPYYYILPIGQHDTSELVHLVNLLKEHGVSVYRLVPAVTIDGVPFNAGDIVIPLSQPFRPFIKEVMEAQEFPVRRYTPGGEVIQPYDIASWSLPLHQGVEAIEITEQSRELEASMNLIREPFRMRIEIPAGFRAAVFSADNNESYKAAFLALQFGMRVERLEQPASIEGTEAPRGSFVIFNKTANGGDMAKLLDEMTVSPLFLKDEADLKSTPLSLPRIALVETYFHDMDAGWTRYVFDTYHIPFEVIRPGDFKKIDFEKRFDVVVFPDANESVLMNGKYKGEDEDDYYISNYPPEYMKGIGKEGMPKLMSFLDGGGIIVSWGESAGLFKGTLEIKRGKDTTEEFQLPVNDVSEKLKKAGLYCPGSLLRI
ncbi:MAG: hypothetical protein HY770_03000, partial [Chitinivibrionia bacterium]|nr:hypothetical protein [Chitinivibrionia bacterium]